MRRGRKDGQTGAAAVPCGSYIRLRAISSASRNFADCQKAKSGNAGERVTGAIE